MIKRNTTSNRTDFEPPRDRKVLSETLYLVRTLGGLTISSMFQKLKGEHHRSERILDSMESNGFVRLAPHLSEQINDETRGNIITGGSTYRDGTVQELSTPYQEVALSEKDSLAHLAQFLKTVEDSREIVGVENAEIARSMSENLAFIGDKEFEEASSGIAQYWKEQLQRRDNLQLLVCVGGQHGGLMSDGRSQKSDGYLLDTILAHFSDDELERFTGRIIFNHTDISAGSTAKAVLLDDWTISGTQLRQAHSNLSYFDDEVSEYEVCLVAASGASIRHGLDVYKGNIPIRAYFKVNDPTNQAAMEKVLETNGAYPGYITGAHSSVDFNFDQSIARMVSEAAKQSEAGVDVPDILTTMPAATQVTRKYYERTNVQPNVERLNKVNGKSYYDTETGQFINKDR
jgi:hypothetical protein